MASSNLVQLIKKIAIEAINTEKPCDYRIGVVTCINPLEVNISQNMTLDEDFLRFTNTIMEQQLENGDKVLMIRKHGGNEYVVLDKVVSGYAAK